MTDRISLAQWEDRLRIFEKGHGRCTYCGLALVFSAMHIDHVLPRTQGGEDVFDNLVPACQACNNSKKGRTPAQWSAVLHALPPRATTLRVDPELLRKARYFLDEEDKSVNEFLLEQLTAYVRQREQEQPPRSKEECA